jgi:hypothetical protein
LSKQKSRKDAKAIIGSYDDALFLRKKKHTHTNPACDEKDKDQPPRKTNKQGKEEEEKNKQDRPNRSDLLVNNIRRVADKESLPPSTEKKKLLQLSISPSQ